MNEELRIKSNVEFGIQNSEELEESLEVCASEDFFLFGGVVGDRFPHQARE